MHPRKPSALQAAKQFTALTGQKPPPKSKIYKTNRPSPVRAIPEFDPMGGVLISYPGSVSRASNQIQLPPDGPRSFGIPNELIVRMQQAEQKQPVHIFIMCADLDLKEDIVSSLKITAKKLKLEFDPSLIHLVPWDTDTYWTRDYGPWWVENTKTGYYGIAKHLYTSLGGGSVGLVEGAEHVDPREGSGIFRPNDDYGADKFSDYLNAPIRKWNASEWVGKTGKIKPHNWMNTGLLDVGGNYMVNGEGLIASSYLVATQNELPVNDEKELTNPSAAVIQSRMEYILSQLNVFMGVDSYHVLTDPSGTYIGHIDCWGKFLGPKKILIANSQDKAVNDAYDLIAKSFQKEGFKVFRVMCQDIYVPIADAPATTAAYTNSLILNNHVYVPVAGGQWKKYDKQALDVYQKAMPKHTIVGIESKPAHPWLGTDAMHCRTRGVPREVVNNWLQSQLLK